MDYINYVKQSPMMGQIGFGGGATSLGRYAGGSVQGPHDGNRAIAGGGYTAGYVSTIGYKTISTLGNFSYFGELGDAKYGLNAASGGDVDGDATRALFMGGGDTKTDNINYVTVATTGNSSYFGDLLEAIYQANGTCSNGPRILYCGGYGESGQTQTINYVATLTTGNAQDFGDMYSNRYAGSGTSDGSRGIIFGGYSPSNKIDYITIDTLGNSANFGTLSSNASTQSGSFSNNTLGFVGGLGELGIDKITIATLGNGTDVGDLTANRWGNPGCSNGESGDRGMWIGGYDDGVNSNVVDYITMSSAGNATDFGDLNYSARGLGACSGD